MIKSKTNVIKTLKIKTPSSVTSVPAMVKTATIPNQSINSIHILPNFDTDSLNNLSHLFDTSIPNKIIVSCS